jgi:hypothetical protein
LIKTKDDFSSSQTVESKDVTLKDVFPLLGSKQPWNLDMSFMLEGEKLRIVFTHKSQLSSSSLSSIFFKFQDGTILKKETSSGEGIYNTGHGYTYRYTFFDLTKEELEFFASKDLLKFRADFSLFPDYPVVEDEIKAKNITVIRKDATCILEEYNLLPKTKIEVKKEINENSNMPIPNNDTVSVSLYKQWKLVTLIDSTGLPKDMNSTQIMQLYNNGTFKQSIVFPNKTVMTFTGKYTLLNDNKIIACTLDDGQSYSFLILKLSKTELNLKSEKYQSFYVSY